MNEAAMQDEIERLRQIIRDCSARFKDCADLLADKDQVGHVRAFLEQSAKRYADGDSKDWAK